MKSDVSQTGLSHHLLYSFDILCIQIYLWHHLLVPTDILLEWIVDEIGRVPPIFHHAWCNDRCFSAKTLWVVMLLRSSNFPFIWLCLLVTWTSRHVGLSGSSRGFSSATGGIQTVVTKWICELVTPRWQRATQQEQVSVGETRINGVQLFGASPWVKKVLLYGDFMEKLWSNHMKCGIWNLGHKWT